jgi:hypothetical protein
MLTLGLDREEINKPPPFWERQFQAFPTAAQKKFDWAFGVILPTICIAADPIVFRSAIGLAGPLLEKYKIFAYVLSSVSIMALCAWLLWGDRLGEARGYLGGLFFVSAAASFLVGLAIFPYSLLGLIILIGALGFTPLLTGFVLLRNTVRTIDSATDSYPTRQVVQSAVLAALYGLAVPFVLNSMKVW